MTYQLYCRSGHKYNSTANGSAESVSNDYNAVPTENSVTSNPGQEDDGSNGDADMSQLMIVRPPRPYLPSWTTLLPNTDIATYSYVVLRTPLSPSLSLVLYTYPRAPFPLSFPPMYSRAQ